MNEAFGVWRLAFMRLSVHALNQTLFDGSVSRITAKTAVGELTILDNHIPLLVPLVSGLLQIQTTTNGEVHEKSTTKFRIRGGFLEVKPKGEVVVLAETASQ